MNRLITLSALVISLLFVQTAFGQMTDKEINKEIKSRAVKEARKEAKRLEKEGWTVQPGNIPLDKQLERAWTKQYQEDESGYPLYLVAEARSVGETHTGSSNSAMEIAKLNLAGLIESKIAGLTEVSIANKEMTREDAATINKVVTASKNLIVQELGMVQVLFKTYRDVGKKNVETLTRIAYNGEMAAEAAKKIIRKELEKESEELHDELDQILDWDKLKGLQ